MDQANFFENRTNIYGRKGSRYSDDKKVKTFKQKMHLNKASIVQHAIEEK